MRKGEREPQHVRGQVRLSSRASGEMPCFWRKASPSFFSSPPVLSSFLYGLSPSYLFLPPSPPAPCSSFFKASDPCAHVCDMVKRARTRGGKKEERIRRKILCGTLLLLSKRGSFSSPLSLPLPLFPLPPPHLFSPTAGSFYAMADFQERLDGELRGRSHSSVCARAHTREKREKKKTRQTGHCVLCAFSPLLLLPPSSLFSCFGTLCKLHTAPDALSAMSLTSVSCLFCFAQLFYLVVSGKGSAWPCHMLDAASTLSDRLVSFHFPSTPHLVVIPLFQVERLTLDNQRSQGSVDGIITSEFSRLKELSLINTSLSTLAGFPPLPALAKVPIRQSWTRVGMDAHDVPCRVCLRRGWSCEKGSDAPGGGVELKRCRPLQWLWRERPGPGGVIASRSLSATREASNQEKRDAWS